MEFYINLLRYILNKTKKYQFLEGAFHYLFSSPEPKAQKVSL